MPDTLREGERTPLSLRRCIQDKLSQRAQVLGNKQARIVKIISRYQHFDQFLSRSTLSLLGK